MSDVRSPAPRESRAERESRSQEPSHATADLSSHATADLSSHATADLSSHATADLSSHATAAPSSRATAAPSSHATAAPSSRVPPVAPSRADALAAHVTRVRVGHGANCSSIGSVIDTLFASAVVGGAIFAAVAAALAREEIRVSSPHRASGGNDADAAKGEPTAESAGDREAPP
jgi:hypothetical protein